MHTLKICWVEIVRERERDVQIVIEIEEKEEKEREWLLKYYFVINLLLLCKLVKIRNYVSENANIL